jgi:hypothetical protein
MERHAHCIWQKTSNRPVRPIFYLSTSPWYLLRLCREKAGLYEVSPKIMYNVLGRDRSAVSANDSRTRVLTMRVTDRDLRGFDAALARRGIAHRSDAMRCLMLAVDDLLRPDEGMTDELRGLATT